MVSLIGMISVSSSLQLLKPIRLCGDVSFRASCVPYGTLVVQYKYSKIDKLPNPEVPYPLSVPQNL